MGSKVRESGAQASEEHNLTGAMKDTKRYPV